MEAFFSGDSKNFSKGRLTFPEMYTAWTSSAPKSVIFPRSSYATKTTSMFPADALCLSRNRTSVREVHVAFGLKKNFAASVAIAQSCRNRIGHVITGLLSWNTEQVPNGLFALSLVQFGTLLLNGHRRLRRCLLAISVWLFHGNPNTSARGCDGASGRAGDVFFDDFFAIPCSISAQAWVVTLFQRLWLRT